MSVYHASATGDPIDPDAMSLVPVTAAQGGPSFQDMLVNFPHMLDQFSNMRGFNEHKYRLAHDIPGDLQWDDINLNLSSQI